MGQLRVISVQVSMFKNLNNGGLLPLKHVH